MDSMCASGVSLLPERSELCHLNNASNKVNLIPSHYPPPGILSSESGTYGTEQVKLTCGQSFPVISGKEESFPPPLPPREPAGCGVVASSQRVVPGPLCFGSANKTPNQNFMYYLDGSDKVLNQESLNKELESVVSNNGSDCVLHQDGDAQQLILLSPVLHQDNLKHTDTDDITHHCWNVLQVHSISGGVGTNKDPSITVTSYNTDDKQNDTSTKAPSNIQSAILNQVIPLSCWPIGTRQPETHFVLNRVTQPPAGNEYVDSPLHATNKDLPIYAGCKRANTATVRLENSLQDCSAVVTTQPTLSSVGKSKGTNQNAGKTDKETLLHRQPPCKEGLICSRCGKCRCMSCTQPRQMPRCWVGPSFYRCECSAQQVVNVCSCLCCIQALFYHCLYHPDDEHDIMMEPCACCESPRCCLRWTILGLLVPCLPCLCLYCPLQCGVDACTSCYNGCNQRGCHCGYNVSSSGSSTTRDLLLDSEPSST